MHRQRAARNGGPLIKQRARGVMDAVPIGQGADRCWWCRRLAPEGVCSGPHPDYDNKARRARRNIEDADYAARNRQERATYRKETGNA